MRIFWVSFLVCVLSSCAVVHHVQLGDLDSRGKWEPFEIKVSEVGIDLGEARDVAKSITRSDRARQQIDDLEAIISLFQMGPSTGNKVYNATYAENLDRELLSVCPSRKITGLVMVRETRKYPIISGEIVKISGWCKKGRSRA